MRAHRGHPTQLGNGHHVAHCEPTLALMESIAETLPDAIFSARKQAYDACADEAYALGLITWVQAEALKASSPYAPVPPGWNTPAALVAGREAW